MSDKNTSFIGVYIPERWKKLLEARAKLEDRSLSSLLRHILKELLQQ